MTLMCYADAIMILLSVISTIIFIISTIYSYLSYNLALKIYNENRPTKIIDNKKSNFY